MRLRRTARGGETADEAKISAGPSKEELPGTPEEPLTLKERAAAIFGMVSAVFLVGIIYVVIFGLVIFALTRLL